MTAPEQGAPGTGGTGLPGPARPGRAGPRWWLLALAALVTGAVLGVVIARAARPAGPPNPAAAQVLPGGYFSRLHGPQAPSWQLPSLADPARTVTLSQFRGRPLVINFWASWCPPCRKEMPALEREARLLAGQVGFVGLDTQDEGGAGLAFARRMGVTYPLATDNAQVYGSYGVNGLPTTFFVAANGTIVGRQVGGMTQASLAALARQVFGIAAGAGKAGTRPSRRPGS